MQLTKKLKIPVPWLLLTKSAKEYLDMDCLPECFVIMDPLKFTQKVLDKLWNHWMRHCSEKKSILQFVKAQNNNLLFGLPRIEHPEVHKKLPYLEVGSSEDEQELVAGKGKAANATLSCEAVPLSAGHPLSKQAHLSGQPEVPEEKSPAANQHNHFLFLQCLSKDFNDQELVHILSLLPIFMSLSFKLVFPW